MNNDEKREYISRLLAVQSDAYSFYSEMHQQFFNSTPKSLFKYKKIDEYIFDMIDNRYIYMATPKELDDPFECSVDIDIKEIYEGNTDNLSAQTMELVFNTIVQFFGSEKKKEIVRDIYAHSIVNGEFVGSRILEMMMDYSNLFTNAEQKVLVNVPLHFKSTIEREYESGKLQQIVATAARSNQAFGIYSLTETNDNKMMWSTYADHHKGCCIEYDFSDKKYFKHLFPVIYESNYHYNVMKAIISFTVSSLVRQFSDNTMPSDLSQFYAPYVTKDKTFEQQQEWRLLNDPKSKMPSPKIKAIYLGNKMSLENIEKMKERARKFGFKLYKANVDKIKNRFNFEEIIL